MRDNTVTLTDTDDVALFQEGMVIVAIDEAAGVMEIAPRAWWRRVLRWVGVRLVRWSR